MTVRSTVTIPPELLEQVERGNVLLFVGERLNRDSSGEAIFERLAAELADRIGITDAPTLTFAEIAQAYEDERGRHALVDFVSRRIEELGDEPQPVHRLIAGLTQCDVLITTTLSGRLERAFREAGRKLQPVIRNEDVAFEDEQVTQLYKLRGSLDRRDSLVLTEEDNEGFFEAQDSISIVLQGYLARKTILFIGYDLQEDHFKRLYSKIFTTLDRFSRRSYALGEAPQLKTVRWCKRKGIEVIEADIADFLQALTNRLAELARAPALAPPPGAAPDAALPEQPYKLLDYYEAGDAAIYFGREAETQDLSSRIRAHRLTLLYGASGVGKTSLLLSGAANRLAQQDQPYEMIYARALEDPAQAIRRALTRRLPDAALPHDGPLVDFLVAAARALGRTVVLALDQFEEFFIRLSPQFRAAFADELGAVCDASDLPIKVVLSLREDWLASINELEHRIPEIFRNRMRVLPLTREQAYQAITAPVERLGTRYEPALVERLLNDLAGGASAEIMPPQLQLVCSALYRRLAPGERTISLASYAQIGGARGVLQKYLDDELARLGRDDRALARGVLAELVTAQGTKAVRSVGELMLALDAAQAALWPVLESLVRARLLRVIEREDGAPSYELAHEYLIREIALEDDARARKQAEEIIRQEVDNWQRFGTLLAADKLALIGDARALLRLGPEAQELLLRSAIEVDDEVDYWLERMADPAQRARVLADKARTRVPAVRRRTARVLGTQDVPESVDPLLALALRDPDYSVRDAARASLAQLAAQRPALIARLRDAAQSKQREERAAALRTLARLPLRELPGGLRRQVLATRLRLRAARIAQTTVATPARRATLITAGLLLTLLALIALVSLNAYFIDVNPALIQGWPSDIVIYRGLPILPGFSQIEVDTGLDVSRVSPEQFNAVTRRQLWGIWLLHDQRDYDKWGKDLAITFNLQDSARMLWYLSRDEGFERLQEVARSPDNNLRGWSAQAFGELLFLKDMTPFSAYDELLLLLKDSDHTVRANAVAAMGMALSNPQVNTLLVVKPLLPLLKDPDADVRASAASVLGQAISKSHTNTVAVVAALLPLLKDPYSEVSARAIDALGQAASNPQLNTQLVITPLLPLLKDADRDVRANVVAALGQAASNPQTDTKALVVALLPLLNDADSNVRANGIDVLGQAASNPQTDTKALVAALLPLLKDTDSNVRANTVYALGQAASNPQTNTASLVTALLPLLKDTDSNVRANASDGLIRVARNPQTDTAVVITALFAVFKDNENTYIDPQTYYLHSSATSLLNRLVSIPERNAAAITTLLHLLTDPDAKIRTHAADALGQAARYSQTNGASVVAALLPLLKDPDATMRVSAADALGQAASNPQANAAAIVAALLPLLRDADPNVRASGADALGQVASIPQANAAAIVAALLPLLRDSNIYVRAHAADALGWAASNPQTNAAAVVAALLPLLKDADDDVRTSAADALGQAAGNPQTNAATVVTALLPLLKDPDAEMRISALGALDQVASNPQIDATVVIAALLPLLNDSISYVRDRAANVLVQAAHNPQINARVVTALLPLLKNPDAGMRDHASEAIIEIYAQPRQTTADPIRVQIFEILIDPHNSLARPSAAHALFLIALRDQKQEQYIRDKLNSNDYARSRSPIARLWSNKVLTMLTIADTVRPAAHGDAAQQQLALRFVQQYIHQYPYSYSQYPYSSSSFFGEDFDWAAGQANGWLNEQIKPAPGASP